MKKKTPCPRDNFGSGPFSNLYKSIYLADHPGIKGEKGIYTSEFIPKGTIVWDDPIAHVDARLIPISSIDSMDEKEKDWVAHYCYQVTEADFRAPNDAEDAATMTNHSCDGNTGWVEDGTRMVAIRDIQIGEEITFDYATSEVRDYGFVECMCGAECCRKIVGPEDYLVKEIQEKYKDYFMPFIQDRIDKINKK
jgi:hypothetical protein